MGLRVLLFSLHEIFSFPLKISLMVLYPFKSIPTPEVAQSLGWLTRGLRGDSQVKSMSHRWHPPWLWCCPGMSPWEPHGTDKTRNRFWESLVVYYARAEKLLCTEQNQKADLVLAERWVGVSGLAQMVPGSPHSPEQDLPEKWKLSLKYLSEENTPPAACGLFFVAPGFGNINYFSSLS